MHRARQVGNVYGRSGHFQYWQKTQIPLICLVVAKARRSKVKRCGEQSERSEQSEEYKRLGYSVLETALPADVASNMLADFESDLSSWASDCDLDRETYLGVVNKWSHWNSRVAVMTEQIAPMLRPRVQEVLQSEAWPVGATIFRKSSQASRGTHAHQDLSYAWRPGSQLFSCTTWVALTPASASPLEMLPGSHRHGLGAAVDFLEPGFQDRASSQEWKENAVTLEVEAGDAILFDSRLWHSAAPCRSNALRVALAIIWATPAGPDGTTEGTYPRWPVSAIPPPALVPKDGFGMDTVGSQLKIALRWLLGEEDLHSAKDLIHAILQPQNAKQSKLQELPDPELAKQLLRKFLEMRQAVLRHGAAGQNGGLFEALYETVILPVKALKEGELKQATQASKAASPISKMADGEESNSGVGDVKRWLQDWAKETSGVLALVLFGSQASPDQMVAGSDIDLCVLCESSHDLMRVLANALETQWLNGQGVCITDVEEQKLFVLIPHGDGVLAMDCFVVEDFQKVQKFLATSVSPESCAEAVLYARDYDAVRQQLLGTLPKPRALRDVQHLSLELRKVLVTFLQSFERASAKTLRGDHWQAFFYRFILYDCLVKLQYMESGGYQHLYLPKWVFHTLSSDGQRRLQSSLDPGFATDRKWHTHGGSPLMLIAYLHQFKKSVNSENFHFASAIQHAMDRGQLSRGIESMHRVLCHGKCFGIHDHIFGFVASQTSKCSLPEEISRFKAILDLDEGLGQDDKAKDNTPKDIVCLRTPISADQRISNQSATDSANFGQFLRALLVVDFPVLVRSEDGRKIAAVGALLRFFWGCETSTASTARNSLTLTDAWDLLDAVEMLHVLKLHRDEVESIEQKHWANMDMLKVKVALNCGLTLDEFTALSQKFTGSLGDQFAAPIRLQFHLAPGEPNMPCRDFQNHEAELLAQHLFRQKASKDIPTGVFITGLPAAGKSACLEGVLKDLQLEAADAVNLDVDGIRRFHSQYQHYAQRMAWSSSEGEAVLESFQDLPSWFRAQNVLYEKSNNSIVSELIRRRCDFVLPGIFDDAGTLQFMVDVLKEGYQVHLVGVHVSPDTAQKRAKIRARETGRLSCDLSQKRDLDREAAMIHHFGELADCVSKHGGIVCLYSNEAEMIGTKAKCLQNASRVLFVGDSTTQGLLQEAIGMYSEVRVNKDQLNKSDVCQYEESYSKESGKTVGLWSSPYCMSNGESRLREVTLGGRSVMAMPLDLFRKPKCQGLSNLADASMLSELKDQLPLFNVLVLHSFLAQSFTRGGQSAPRGYLLDHAKQQAGSDEIIGKGIACK
eukprot:Skav215826  [mRNA]  locus=scaffold2501:28277:39759:+ [translate_table: standard]